MEFQVDPRVTAVAALTACREKSVTNEEIKRWIDRYTQDEKPPELESGIKICIKLALDTPEWRALAEEINAEAKSLGIEAADLATAFVREGLAQRRRQPT